MRECVWLASTMQRQVEWARRRKRFAALQRSCHRKCHPRVAESSSLLPRRCRNAYSHRQSLHRITRVSGRFNARQHHAQGSRSYHSQYSCMRTGSIFMIVRSVH